MLTDPTAATWLAALATAVITVTLWTLARYAPVGGFRAIRIQWGRPREPLPQIFRSAGLGVTFASKEIERAWVLRAEVHNVGRQPIEKAHFDGPLSLILPAWVTIVSASAKLYHPGLRRSAATPVEIAFTNPGRVDISGCLMNPGDTIAIEVIADASRAFDEDDIRFSAHVVGTRIAAPRRSRMERWLATLGSRPGLTLRWLLGIAATFVMSARLLGSEVLESLPSPWPDVITAGAAVLLPAIIALGFLLRRRPRGATRNQK